MSGEPQTETGRALRDAYLRENALGVLDNTGITVRVLAIEAEAIAQERERLAAAVGWLKDPLWPHFGPGIGPGPHDPGRVAARAAAQQVLALMEDTK